MITFRNLIVASALLVVLAGQALAVDYTALRNDTRVHNELLAASIAWEIADQCETIKQRRAFGVIRALELQSYARKLGYTNAELEAYVNSKEEQDRFRAIAEPWMVSQGVVLGQSDTYCALGEAQMEKGTLVGRLLRH